MILLSLTSPLLMTTYVKEIPKPKFTWWLLNQSCKHMQGIVATLGKRLQIKENIWLDGCRFINYCGD